MRLLPLIGTALVATAWPLLRDGGCQDRDLAAQGAYCSATAAALFRACGFEVLDDDAKATAICLNFTDEDEREECFEEAEDAREEHELLCRRQRAFRGQDCTATRQAPYDPDFHPRDFDDPRHPTHPNPFFPLAVGNRWRYEGGGEVNEIEVLDRTKLIDDVTCLVVGDRVDQDGTLRELTDDWFAIARDGNVWYCGEEV